MLAGGLQQSSYTRSPCRQLEIKALSTNIKHIVLLTYCSAFCWCKATVLFHYFFVSCSWSACKNAVHFAVGRLTVQLSHLGL